MARHALIDSGNNVVNVIEWNTTNLWAVPAGMQLVPAQPQTQIGDTWNPVSHAFSSGGVGVAVAQSNGTVGSVSGGVVVSGS